MTDRTSAGGARQLMFFEIAQDAEEGAAPPPAATGTCRPVAEPAAPPAGAPAESPATSPATRSTQGAPAGPEVDHEARRVIDTELDETVFAVAGAGSGKTRHLVERVLNVVVSGRARVDQLAVITFTEAAAAELRERIAAALDKVVTADCTEPDVRERALAALTSLDGAAITTLHGFARRILSAHPFDAGLPPTFDVLDEARSLADLDEHWVDSVDALLSDEVRAQAVQWCIVAGADLGKLRVLVRRMGENWDRLVPLAQVRSHLRVALPRLEGAAVTAPLRRALALDGRCTDAGDALAVHLQALRPYLEHLERAVAGDDELQLLRLLVRPPRKLAARTKGVASAWDGHKPEVTALLDEAETARTSAARRAIGAAMEVVGDALAGLAVTAARRRQHEGRVQFHDLLVLACELVRSHPEVRAALHDEYRYLFVDEYQDTDPLQAELVTMIAAAPGAPVGAAEWWQLDTTPGALFFVGDPLQSIYAFRRADVGTFLLTLDRVATRKARLVTNYRSAPGIVEFVNGVFDKMVGRGEPGVQPRYEPSSAARAADDDPPRAVSVIGAGADHEISAAAARALEAQEVAALLRQGVDEGWPVGAGGRPVQLDDVAVLVPTRTSVPALEAAFEAAGVDYRLESSSLVYDTREVQELLHVLRAVDDPSDSASVVAALRTPGFACGDDDLLRHRLAGGHWDYRIDPPAAAGDDPVRCGLRRLRRLHESRTWTGVSELVAAVVEETRQLDAALEARRWREEWRRLRFVVDQARQFAETSPGTLRQYLAWVDVQRDEDAKVTEVVLPEADVPAVSVMTVHAAKGLEFPVVAVVGLGGGVQGATTPAVLFGPDGIELAVNKAVSTNGFDAARQGEQRIFERERLRLLYVALTRAQNHLVVSVHRPKRSGTTTAAALEGALLDLPELWGPFVTAEELVAAAFPGNVPLADVEGPQVAPAPGATRAVAPPSGGALHADTPEEHARWREDRSRRLAARPSVISATAVAKLAAAGSEPSIADTEVPRVADDGAGDDPAAQATGGSAARSMWRRGRAGTAVGRAVHAVLQTVDLRTGDGLEAMSQAHSTAEGVPSHWQEVAALAQTALASPVVRRAVAGRFWRELYVGAPFGDGVLEGFVDLLFEGDEGLEVVDYKTDQIKDDDEADRLAARYRLQGAAYAAAVCAATGRPVSRCSFLFLRGRQALERTVADLETAIGEVQSVVGAPHGRAGGPGAKS